MSGKLKKTDPRTPWINANPLRRWRSGKKIKMEGLAGVLGVSRQLIYAWESGQAIPSENNFNKITDLTGIQFCEWIEWKNNCPRLKLHNGKLTTEEKKNSEGIFLLDGPRKYDRKPNS